MSAGGGDPELGRLLLAELVRHAPALSAGAAPFEQKRAVHALKGSAGLAGERALSEALARIERRFSAGSEDAAEAARALVEGAIAALQRGDSVALEVWPAPPRDLVVTSVDPTLFPNYTDEMLDRIERIDRAVASGESDAAAVQAAFREVHAIKGAALASGDEVTSWFAHGLEEVLRGAARDADQTSRALADLSRWRSVLAEMLVAPERALDTLRILTGTAAPSRSSAPPKGRRSDTSVEPQDYDEPRPSIADDNTLRVPVATLDRLFERLRLLGQARAEVAACAGVSSETASEARALRLLLAEALRLIGPPRPWGAPAAAIERVERAAAALGDLAELLERQSTDLKETADHVRFESTAAHGELASIRTTSVARLFGRIGAIVSAEARRVGSEVHLVFEGEETPIDRRIADLLIDPVLQLARNAIAHGIEPSVERIARGKSRFGTLRLIAAARSGGLRIVVEDDGAGVDVADVRRRAIARGMITPEVARAADTATLLSLLFVPGFSTRDGADLLAGRGVGLDLALEVVHRMGGTIRLASQPGRGLAATLDIPSEPGLMKVIRVDVDDSAFVIPAHRVRRIVSGRDPEAQRSMSLLLCVHAPLVVRESVPSRRSQFPLAIELETGQRGPGPIFGVDRVGTVEETAIRSISPLIALAGPYTGAIVRGAELLLCLDAHALIELAGARDVL